MATAGTAAPPREEDDRERGADRERRADEIGAERDRRGEPAGQLVRRGRRRRGQRGEQPTTRRRGPPRDAGAARAVRRWRRTALAGDQRSARRSDRPRPVGGVRARRRARSGRQGRPSTAALQPVEDSAPRSTFTMSPTSVQAPPDRSARRDRPSLGTWHPGRAPIGTSAPAGSVPSAACQVSTSSVWAVGTTGCGSSAGWRRWTPVDRPDVGDRELDRHAGAGRGLDGLREGERRHVGRDDVDLDRWERARRSPAGRPRPGPGTGAYRPGTVGTGDRRPRTRAGRPGRARRRSCPPRARAGPRRRERCPYRPRPASGRVVLGAGRRHDRAPSARRSAGRPAWGSRRGSTGRPGRRWPSRRPRDRSAGDPSEPVGVVGQRGGRPSVGRGRRGHDAGRARTWRTDGGRPPRSTRPGSRRRPADPSARRGRAPGRSSGCRRRGRCRAGWRTPRPSGCSGPAAGRTRR